MHIWKLGCNWGAGAPDFYEFIKQESIVISDSPRLFLPGDLIAITQGFTVRAIAEVLEDMKESTSRPDYEAPFQEYQIAYDNKVFYANAKWRELMPTEIFKYELQKGIRQIQQVEIKEKILAIWQGSTSLETPQSVTEHEKNRSQLLNQIYYGPPGTGKTFQLLTIQQKFTDQSIIQSEKEFRREIVSDLSWWEVLALCIHEKGRMKVPELLKHPLVESKFVLSDIKHRSQRIWSVLQIHTVLDCPNVELNEQRRHGIAIFYKEKDSVWRFDEGISLENDIPDLFQIWNKLQVGPVRRELKKRYTFTTCHQSLTYEDFIEGIKPRLGHDDNEIEEIKEVVYQIEPGIFYKACEKASRLAGYDNLSSCLSDTKEGRKAKFLNAPTYCIFLDEINRMNLSGVFGELITLIESDKRLGEKNEIIVSETPYSKQPFGIPSNLYLIGTMNTADRSVEALDTALRRRFSFIEMPPKPELFKAEQFAQLFPLPNTSGEFLDLEQMIRALNKRIEKLIDKDHCIGHAFFMELPESSEGLQELRRIFQNKIIPLLQEYFYGNFGKMELVIGKAFFEQEHSNPMTADAFFAYTSDYEGKEDAFERKVYHLKNWLETVGGLTDYRYSDSEFLGALVRIYTPHKNG